MRDLELQKATDYQQEAEQRFLIDVDTSNINHEEESNKLLMAYNDGWVSIDIMFAKLQHMAKILDITIDKIKPKMEDYVYSIGKNGLIVNGIEIKPRNGSNKAIFDNNPLILDLENKLKSIKEISKTLAKNGQKEIADTETGELIYPCKFEAQKDTITITFKK